MGATRNSGWSCEGCIFKLQATTTEPGSADGNIFKSGQSQASLAKFGKFDCSSLARLFTRNKLTDIFVVVEILCLFGAKTICLVRPKLVLTLVLKNLRKVTNNINPSREKSPKKKTTKKRHRNTGKTLK